MMTVTRKRTWKKWRSQTLKKKNLHREMKDLPFPEIRGIFWGRPYIRDYPILRSISYVGARYSGKLPYSELH